ncbi:MAG TPA: efflux RND transporter periplasmic adaptor subunit [Bryobacteraceae bacterium]|jgi:RND family efflux transporter MFP subunit|nr:efflux RND transporter periplasmic adaptor subunit [Bryobacteraceae bacterium]
MTVEETPPNRAANSGPAQPKRQSLGAGFYVLLLIAAAAIGWFVYKGIEGRVSAETALVKETHTESVLSVSVVSPKEAGGGQELVLPGNTLPLIDAPIYARTSGYLTKWFADIGTRVHAGDVLAEIETPEIDQQLSQAKSDLETAKTNLQLAQTTADRWVALEKKGAVARQDTDNIVADMKAKKTIADSAAANVKRLENLQSFEKVVAPFDGVITARSTDIGALINAGAGSSAGKELFHISAINKLRVFINVPEEYDQAALNGGVATLTLNEFPGRTFRGIIVRNSSSIDPSSRTLLVEVDVDNSNGELLPGAYVSVHLKKGGEAASALTVPVNTLLFRSEGLRAAVVRDNRAELVPVQVGRDFGDTLEIVAGLKAADQLIVNPPDSLVSGTPVHITSASK